MKSTGAPPPVFEFYFPDVDTLLQVAEEPEGAVVIRATRDSFSDRRKSNFIRELAAEGFIPDSYRWLDRDAAPVAPGVRWLVDRTWVRLPVAALAETDRMIVRLLAGGFLLWLGLLLWLIQR
jgi:hypothetical protein